jgi:transcriptional regulator with GAF, ATPase, and Fis domain
MTETRIEFSAPLPRACRARFQRRLAEAGVVAAADTSSPDPVLVVCDTIGPSLERHVAALSQQGLVRVLVVVTDDIGDDDRAVWRLLDAGASDIVAWDAHGTAAPSIAARLERWREVDDVVDGPGVRESLVGRGTAWQILLRQIVEVGRFTDAAVLLTGESGTGKELIAHLIHDLDSRPDKGDFVVVDCSTVVPTLSAPEFFGNEKGAFSGAISMREGAFALADGGTLFLDEVGELALPLQAELLRVIQEGMYKRVGSDTWRTTSFRLVCATNRDLRQEMREGRFRSDLYYRIAEWTFHLPPLRDRLADIPDLVGAFLAQTNPRGEQLELSGPVQRLLADRDYPGNVRDLRQAVMRIAKSHVGAGPITVGDVPPADRRPSAEGAASTTTASSSAGSTPDELLAEAVRVAVRRGASLRDITKSAAAAAIRTALIDEGTPGRAAQRLGISSRALQLRRAADRRLGANDGRQGPDGDNPRVDVPSGRPPN